MIKRTALVSVMLAATVACGQSEQERQAEEAARQIQEGAQAVQRGAEQMAQGGAAQLNQGLQQMAQGLQQMGQNASVKAVNFEALKELLPTVGGWEQSNARGQELSAPIAYSRAEAQYRNGDARIELQISDSGGSQILIAPFSMLLAAGYSERSDDGFKRSTTINGSPAVEEWNNGSKHGEVTMVVGSRFIVQATGNDVADLAPVRQLVEAVDATKLGALK